MAHSTITIPSSKFEAHTTDSHSPEKNRLRSILVVDDDPESLATIGLNLDKIGLELLIARNGHEAISLSREHKPYLILLDVMMHDMDGFEVCRRLKDDPNTTRIPVVFLSTDADTESRLKGFEAGGIDFISKPVDKRELRSRIKSHVRNRSKFRKMERRNHELKKEINQLKLSITRGSKQDVFKDIFNHTGLFISLLDTDGKFLRVNHYAQHLFGYTPEEMLEMSSHELNHPAYLSLSKEAVTFLNDRENDSCEFEKKFIRKDKSEFWGMHSLHVIRDHNDELLGMVCTVQDITLAKNERLEMEAELTTARNLTAQLADQNLEQNFKTTSEQNSMDLKTILASLTNMLDSSLTEDQKKQMENIQSLANILTA